MNLKNKIMIQFMQQNFYRMYFTILIFTSFFLKIKKKKQILSVDV